MPSLPEISARAAAFDERLIELKSQMPVDFDWYPYNTLGGFYELVNVLAVQVPDLFDSIGTGQVLDLCCADGDLSFFLETLGYQVTAVDLARTNYNRMAGIQVLKKALESQVQIRELDLDTQFTLHDNYGLVVFMGGLYHLKNPFHVLDTLARHASHLIVSTRIARFTPDKKIELGQVPVAYLLAEDEANNDCTNYWIFSEPGLRLFQRTKWDVCSFLVLGAETNSDPASNDADARAFCLLRSRLIPNDIELLSGWHRIESSGWRWTMRRFSINVRNLPVNVDARLRLRFAVPDVLLNALGPIRLSASRAGTALPGAVYSTPGEHEYEADVPPHERGGKLTTFQFELDKALAPGTFGDDRELGIIVSEAAVRCQPPAPQPGHSPTLEQ